MFQDVAIGTARFKSKQLKQTRDAGTVTTAVAVSEGETQTDGGWTEASTQTEAKSSTASSTGKNPNPAETEEERSKTVAFLQRIGPLMLAEMSKNAKNSAYFGGLEKYLEESEEKNIAKLFTLRFDYDAFFQAPTQATSETPATSSTKKPVASANTASMKLSCTGVSWNATGAMIAVAYGRFDHTGWCNYRSALCIWCVFQSDFNASKPNLVLEASSGLMCVAFHPKNPSLVAAGSFNGEVFVWDLEPEEYRFYSSGIGDYFHREPVTKVAWVYDVHGAEYNIASVSGDGKVLFWRLKDKLAYPVEGYVMHLASGSTTAAGRSGSESHADRPVVIGGKALAFSPSDKTSRSFIVGSEGGAVVRCFSKGMARSSDFKGEKKWTATAARLVGKLPSQRIPAVRRQVENYATEKKTREITLAMVYEAKLDPQSLYPSAMDFVFEPHGGPVYDLSFSPFRKSLFVSCASDGTARVFSYLQKEPLLSLEVAPTASYLYAIEWSRTRPMVFAVAAEDGNVYVYDLKADRVSPVLTLSAKDSTSGSTRDVKSSSRSSSKSTTSASATPSITTAVPPMLALDFNPRQRNFLAAGDATGTVHIWKLSWQLANLQAGELSLLEAMEEESSADAA
ncbi:hypothetical protein Poli38472_008181 [Pythium oligandrum]|uniref:Dynein intermediate chain n=1 Tax=Pythium oligandrum TaxID=41045 RepID=A0A8K1CM13_PYTOL|nr:hypothetical protein Poli38472_008181 [Pythium oligandrum]|eukprot:TMW65539.1 hypothetical protein Poli38472_008181 [Pythium oligandrum]